MTTWEHAKPALKQFRQLKQVFGKTSALLLEWQHGVILASLLGTAATAATRVGALRASTM